MHDFGHRSANIKDGIVWRSEDCLVRFPVEKKVCGLVHATNGSAAENGLDWTLRSEERVITREDG